MVTRVIEPTYVENEEETFPEGQFMPDSMDFYLDKIGKRSLLTKAEEQEYSRRAKQGDMLAKQWFIESNLRLVVSVAKSYVRSGVPLADIIQEGNIGLMKAVDAFDWEKGFRFSTYAVIWIRQAITRAIDRQSRAIRQPSYVIQSMHKLNRLSSQMAGEMGREPTVDELATRAELSTEKVVCLLAANEALVSLDDGQRENSVGLLVEKIQDLCAVDPEGEVIAAETAEVVDKLLSGLSPQERMIIEKRFGLKDGDRYTLQQIGQELNITRERVRQLEARALRRLRITVSRHCLDHYFE